MSLERSWSPTAVQMFSQGLGSSLLASTRRSLDHSGICSTVLEVLSLSLGPCQLPQASGNNFCCQESISYFSSISERWLARMIDASHHPYKLSLQLRHQQAQGCVPSSKSPGQLCTLSGTQPKKPVGTPSLCGLPWDPLPFGHKLTLRFPAHHRRNQKVENLAEV